MKVNISFLFLKYFLLIMLLQFSKFSPLYTPSAPHHPTLQHSPPPQFMSMGCTYKFFEFSVSYTNFYISLSILCLLIMLLLPCTFSPYSSLSPCQLNSLHVMSISLILFLFQLFAQFVFVFAFQVQLLIVVEFVVILLFIFFIFFFFLGKSL